MYEKVVRSWRCPSCGRSNMITVEKIATVTKWKKCSECGKQVELEVHRGTITVRR